MLSGQATHTNCIVFGLTRSWLEPAIYRTRGEHATHYATDAQYDDIMDRIYLNKLDNQHTKGTHKSGSYLKPYLVIDDEDWFRCKLYDKRGGDFTYQL